MKMMSLTLFAITLALFLHSACPVEVVTLDLTNPSEEGYKSFLTDIRTNVKDPKRKYGGMNIPVLGAPTGTFLRVNIQTSSGTVSLGLTRDDLYVVSYMAKNDKLKERVYYFKDQITSTNLDGLFPESKGEKNQQAMEYKESYAAIEGKAGATRKEAGLGVGKIVQYMNEVNGKLRKVKSEAKFLLVAIQMVSEAARFAYIENLVIENFPNGFTPEDKVMILENNWGDISKDVKKTKDGKFEEPITYKANKISTTWTVSDATELEIGIFKYIQ